MRIAGQCISKVRGVTIVNTQGIAKLESQIGQIANHLGEREKGKLQSQPVPNPKVFALEILQVLRTDMKKCNLLSHLG